jgi:hypothetical protein
MGRRDDITPRRAALRDFKPAYVGPGCVKTLRGQNEKGPFSGLCRLPPAADIRSRHVTVRLSAQIGYHGLSLDSLRGSTERRTAPVGIARFLMLPPSECALRLACRGPCWAGGLHGDMICGARRMKLIECASSNLNGDGGSGEWIKVDTLTQLRTALRFEGGHA